MAYATPAAKSASDVMSLADYNVFRNNFIAMAPDIFTTLGDLQVATNADTGARLGIGPADSMLVATSSASANMEWHPAPTALAYNTTVRSFSINTWANLTMDSEVYDSDSCHSTVSNTERLTVPASGAGVYLIGARCMYETSGLAAGTDMLGLRLQLQGGTEIALRLKDGTYHPTNMGSNINLEVATEYRLADNDWVRAQALIGAAMDIPASGILGQAIWFQWLRR